MRERLARRVIDLMGGFEIEILKEHQNASRVRPQETSGLKRHV